MKNFIIYLLFLTVVCYSCVTTPTNERTAVQKEYGDTRDTKLVTLTVNNESHEFVTYNYSKWENGIAHWPGCKYCKDLK